MKKLKKLEEYAIHEIIIALGIVLLIVYLVIAPGGAPTMEINLISPPDNTETEEEMPAFNFSVTIYENGYICEKPNCTLFLNSTQEDVAYGTKDNINSGSIETITANDTLLDTVYQWHIYCIFDYDGGECSLDSKDVGGIRNITKIPNTNSYKLTINFPKNQQFLNNQTTLINITSTDESLNHTEILLFNQTEDIVDSFNSTTNGTYIVELTAPSDGQYTINATSYDNDGYLNSTNISVIIDTFFPKIEYNIDEILFISKNYIYTNWTYEETYLKNFTANLFNSTYHLINQTNTSNQYINWTDLSDGTYHYNIQICDKAGNCNTTETRTITIDTKNPTLSLCYPLNRTYYTNQINLGYSSVDENIDMTWYEYKGINTTLNYNITFEADEGENILILWANDTAGNVVFNKIVFTVDTIKRPIRNCTELQNINNYLAGNYYLTDNIDCSDTSNWNSGSGFMPIGNEANKFVGILNGKGYNISNLSINRSSDNYIGLFGYMNEYGIINNTGLKNSNITGNNSVGGLIGSNNGTIYNSYSTGNVTGNNNVSGFASSNGGIICNSYSKATVYGNNSVGGIVSNNYIGGTIYNSYSTGNVTGNNNVGGLIGSNNGTIYNSYSTGNVTGNNNVGGLVGYNESGGIVVSSYWDNQTSGQSLSAGGEGKTTNQMKDKSTFDWNFMSVWAINNNTYPFLRYTDTIPLENENYCLLDSQCLSNNCLFNYCKPSNWECYTDYHCSDYCGTDNKCYVSGSGGSSSSDIPSNEEEGNNNEEILTTETIKINLTENIAQIIDFSVEKNSIDKIQVKVNKTTTGAKLIVNKISTKPNDILNLPEFNNTYTYINIKPENIKEENINEIIIVFAVEKEWLEEKNENKSSNEDIVLSQYNNNKSWDDLETLYYKEDKKYNYYIAKASGLNYFAIGLKKINTEILSDTEHDNYQNTGSDHRKTEKNQEKETKKKQMPEEINNTKIDEIKLQDGDYKKNKYVWFWLLLLLIILKIIWDRREKEIKLLIKKKIKRRKHH